MLRAAHPLRFRIHIFQLQTQLQSNLYRRRVVNTRSTLIGQQFRRYVETEAFQPSLRTPAHHSNPILQNQPPNSSAEQQLSWPTVQASGTAESQDGIGYTQQPRRKLQTQEFTEQHEQNPITTEQEDTALNRGPVEAIPEKDATSKPGDSISPTASVNDLRPANLSRGVDASRNGIPQAEELEPLKSSIPSSVNLANSPENIKSNTGPQHSIFHKTHSNTSPAELLRAPVDETKRAPENGEVIRPRISRIEAYPNRVDGYSNPRTTDSTNLNTGKPISRLRPIQPLNYPEIGRFAGEKFNQSGTQAAGDNRISNKSNRQNYKLQKSRPTHESMILRFYELVENKEGLGPLFDHVKEMARQGYPPTLRVYQMLISTIASRDNRAFYYKIALQLYEEILEENFTPIRPIYVNLLKILSTIPDYITRQRILDDIQRFNIPLTQEMVESVILGFLCDSQIERALELFEASKTNGETIHQVVYVEIMKSLGHLNDVDEALRYFKLLQDAFPKASLAVAWHELLNIVTRLYHIEGTMFVWENAVRPSIIRPDDGICERVIQIGGRYGQPFLCVEALRIMQEGNVAIESHHYDSLISALVSAGHYKAAFQTLKTMRKENVPPTDSTGITFVKGLTADNNIELVDKAFEDLKEDAVTSGVDIVGFNSVIGACVALGDVERAFGVFSDAVNLNVVPNVETFNQMLSSCLGKIWNDRIDHSTKISEIDPKPEPPQKELAMYLAGEMKTANMRPNMETFEYLLQISLYQDDYEDAFMYLEEMKSFEQSIGKVRPRTYEWIGWKLREVGDERLEMLLEEMESAGFGHQAEQFRTPASQDSMNEIFGATS